MPTSRRDFLRQAAAVAAAAPFSWQAAATRRPAIPAPTALDLSRLTPYVDPLPRMPVAAPEPRAASRHYRISLSVVDHRVHRDLPPTRFWSFGGTFPGPTIEARRGEPVSVRWANALPARHFLPVDHSIHGAEANQPGGRAVVHVHGAQVRPEYDGHPDRWILPHTSAVYEYPNDQPATLLWYHDHTMGINRLNVYAGLMGLYVIRDEEEDALNLPKGSYEIPLLLCDRFFDDHAQLIYPRADDPDRPWVPEVFGDALLVNGTLLPYLDVEPARYRFRVVNGANGRFMHLRLSSGTPVTHIGGDQGLLGAAAPSPGIELAPAERADVIVDFQGLAGRAITIDNDGMPIMQVRVAHAAGAEAPGPIATLRPIERLAARTAVRTRTHTLGEDRDMTQTPMRMLLNGMPWHMPVTEIAELGSTEIWNLVNTTDDSHPIHLHLVRFQILDRRSFDVFTYVNERTLRYTAAAIPPDATESGWKDTVRAHAGMVTRIIIRFEGYAGRYMWHCHILEHGDNEMMRPLEIVAAGRPTPVSG